MAIMTFLKNIRDYKPITVYQDKHVMDIRRDFTYIDDIVEGIYSCLFLKIEEGGHEIYNLGSDQCICLEDVIRICEEVCGKRAIVEKKPKPDCDVLVTYADNSKAKRDLGYSPRIGLKEGVYKTHEWLSRGVKSGIAYESSFL
jgi:UDP-glucuronate 4-epimerase